MGHVSLGLCPFSLWMSFHTHLSTILLTYSMVQSPAWEASQQIPRISRNPKVHYRTHKPPPPVPIMGQPNSVHMVYGLNWAAPGSWRSILILSTQLRLGLPSGLFPSGFPTKTLYTPSPHPYKPSPSHSSKFYHRTILGEEYRSFSSSLCSLLHSPVTSSFLGPNILLKFIYRLHYITLAIHSTVLTHSAQLIPWCSNCLQVTQELSDF